MPDHKGRILRRAASPVQEMPAIVFGHGNGVVSLPVVVRPPNDHTGLDTAHCVPRIVPSMTLAATAYFSPCAIFKGLTVPADMGKSKYI